MIKTRLVALLSDAKKYIVRQVIWQFIALLCQVLVVFCAANILGGLLSKNLSLKLVIISCVIIAAAIALRFICDKAASNASFAASVDVKRVLREKIYEKILRLGAGWKEKISAAEVTQLAGEGVEQLEVYFGKYLSQLIYSMIAPVVLFIILSFVSFLPALVLLICVPLIPLSIVVVQKIAKKLLSKYWGVYTELGDSFLENMQGLTTLKIYRADEERAVKMDEESQRFRRITMKVLTMQLNSTSVMDIMAYGGAAVGIIAALIKLFNGSLELSGALVIILLASEFFLPLRVLGSFFHIAMNGMASSDKMFALLDLPEPEERTAEIPEGDVGISLLNVDFAYDPKRPVLKNVSMEFPAGSLVAIVGESGCGKSTVSGILMGKNTGYSGEVRAYINYSAVPDGIRSTEAPVSDCKWFNLSDIKEESLMKNFTLVTHESHIFKGSVRENLCMGKRDASDEEMNEALRLVNLLDFINEEGGLSMQLSENAANLSGGQKQRLSIARALLHDSPVYIFDEATSNIDVESEEMIMDVIRYLANTKTVILISHRLANVVDADNIYVMQSGEVKGSGKHGDLMRSSDVYRNLFEAQMKLEAYAGGGTS